MLMFPAGTSKAEHLRDNIAAAAGRMPDAEMLKRIVAAVES